MSYGRMALVLGLALGCEVVPGGVGAQAVPEGGDLGSLVQLRELAKLRTLGDVVWPRDLSESWGLAGLKGLAGLDELVPRAIDLADQPWAFSLDAVPLVLDNQRDAADSVYRAAREALSGGDYPRAAGLFAQITRRFPRSPYAADAMYWEAFARYRQGADENLRSALALLEKQRSLYPKAATRGDAATLATRIRGELARRGDAQVATQAAEAAEPPAEPVVPAVPGTPDVPGAPGSPQGPRGLRPPRLARPPRAPRDYAEVPPGCPSEDDDERVAALNALMQMDADRALPILKKVIARRDECSVALRRKAMFLVAQQRSPESADILLEAVRNDPDPEVRRQGVWWLGQVDAEKATDILGEILRTSTDFELQKSAIFALSQHDTPKAAAMVRSYAEQDGAPEELRRQAIFWIGQRRSAENAAFLRGLYGRLTSPELKQHVLFSLSQMRDLGNERWLLDVALNTNESIDMQEKALFWAGQNGAALPELLGLYERMTDREMKEQLIFVYSQSKESAAVDKLLDIAKKDVDKELRRKAIFWLSQSHDPRVAKFLEDLITQ